MQNLIVGCGLSGATMARLLAEQGEQVIIIDSKDHIAGNIYDYMSEGICVHKYGPHAFHTSNKVVWDFLSRFCSWYPYQHRVKAMVDGMVIPVPFNLDSLHIVFPDVLATRIEQKLLEVYGFNARVPILELRQSSDPDLIFLADYVYNKIFLGYTLKQWGMCPDKIDSSVSARVPVAVSHDERCNQDVYQGVPIGGYTQMIERMLSHPNITVRLNTPYARDMAYDRLFWSGSIDEFFEYKHGMLPYRSERFDILTFPFKFFQSGAQVNYPCNHDFTRITEFKYFLNDQSDKTVVSYEYPEAFIPGQNDRYYPIANPENAALYDKYMEMARKTPNVYFFGRLGDYRYYNMDQAVARAIELFNSL